MDEELIKVIGEVEKEKGLEKDVIIEALEAAMLTAARKRKGLVADLEANFDPETGEVNVIEFYNSTFIPECKELLCSPMATVDGAAASAPGAADLPRKNPQSPTRKLLVCISPLHGTYPYIDACERTCMHVHKHSCICLHAYMHTYIIGAEQHFYLAYVAGARVHKQHRDDAAHLTPLYLRA